MVMSSTFLKVQFNLLKLYLATLTQMIKEMLPPELKMTCQSSELIIQMTMTYLNYLSDQANNVCSNEGKKTITPSHVASALKVRKLDKSKCA
jgi:histone H3/H4